jgi:probable HAF family extracellular repeat protein
LRAFAWSAKSGMLDISTDTGRAGAQAINNHGVVTGSFMRPHAFRWSRATGIEDLGALPGTGGGQSYGMALNDAGIIAGTSDKDMNRHAFIWTCASGMVDIDTLDSDDAMPLLVGEKGEVVGNRFKFGTAAQYTPFLWTRETGMVDLGTAGGIGAFVLAGTPQLQLARAINLADGYQHAMAWTRSAGMRDIGTLGGRGSRALDINARGHIVGASLDTAGAWRAFFWSARDGMVDLNRYLHRAPRGLVLDTAVAINDNGTIVALSNAGIVLLLPVHGHTGGHAVGSDQAL